MSREAWLLTMSAVFGVGVEACGQSNGAGPVAANEVVVPAPVTTASASASVPDPTPTPAPSALVTSVASAPKNDPPPPPTAASAPRHVDASQAICGATDRPPPNPGGDPERHVANMRSAFRRCYQEDPSKPVGSVSFTVTVDTKGDVQSVTPSTSTIPSMVISCIVTRIKKETFEPTNAPWTFTIPLRFVSDQKQP